MNKGTILKNAFRTIAGLSLIVSFQCNSKVESSSKKASLEITDDSESITFQSTNNETLVKEDTGPEKPVWDRIESFPVVTSSWLNQNESNQTNYHPNYIADNHPGTCWATNRNGGKGEWVRFEIGQEVKVSAIRINIQNGLQASRSLYEKNSRPSKLRVLSNGKVLGELDVEDRMERQKLKLDLPNEVQISEITVEVLDVYTGTQYTDCCISEMDIKIKIPDYLDSNNQHELTCWCAKERLLVWNEDPNYQFDACIGHLNFKSVVNKSFSAQKENKFKYDSLVSANPLRKLQKSSNVLLDYLSNEEVDLIKKLIDLKLNNERFYEVQTLKDAKKKSKATFLFLDQKLYQLKDSPIDRNQLLKLSSSLKSRSEVSMDYNQSIWAGLSNDKTLFVKSIIGAFGDCDGCPWERTITDHLFVYDEKGRSIYSIELKGEDSLDELFESYTLDFTEYFYDGDTPLYSKIENFELSFEVTDKYQDIVVSDLSYNIKQP